MAKGKLRQGSKGGKRGGRSVSSRSSGRRNISSRRQTQSARRTTRATRPIQQQRSSSTRRPVVLPSHNSSRSSHSSSQGRDLRPNAAVDYTMQIQQLRAQFARLDQASDLGSVYSEIGEIENRLTNIPAKLDELRRRGYVHAGQLEDRLEDLDDEWDNVIRPRVDAKLRNEVAVLDRHMHTVQAQLTQGLSAISSRNINQLQSLLGQSEGSIRAAENSVRSLYAGIRQGLTEVVRRINRVKWMIEKLESADDITMLEAEGPLVAVEAEWERDGKDEGPDGILYLTDQRLLFEQREEVASKKFLFVTTETEKTQKLLLDVPVKDVEDIAYDEEGRGFLGMRKDDILELILAPSAPYSRVRFHIKGDDAEDWASMLKRVRSGDIDEDRADEYVDEMEAAAAATASLPELCPNCFASVAEQARGVMSVTCEYCGTVITATVPDAGPATTVDAT